jgi:2-polyprenyl-6-methoxyphenol hydroxylase-like FAD-dependent oxidoreductase
LIQLFDIEFQCFKAFGDAAHTIHPLAGQGVNLGFGDAELLAEKVSQINLRDFDEVSTALKQYQRARTAQVHKTAEAMHALHHLFVSQSVPVKTLRAFGMNGLNQISTIKRWLLKQAGS